MQLLTPSRTPSRNLTLTLTLTLTPSLTLTLSLTRARPRPRTRSVVQQATLRRKALLCCHNVGDFPTNDELQTGSIDVWWIKHDGGLLPLQP